MQRRDGGTSLAVLAGSAEPIPVCKLRLRVPARPAIVPFITSVSRGPESGQGPYCQFAGTL